MKENAVKRMLKIFLAFLTTLFMTWSAIPAWGDELQQASGGMGAGGSYGTDEIIVKYKTRDSIQQKLEKYGGKLTRRNDRLMIGRIKLPAGKTWADEIAKYKNDPDVEYAEPNYRYKLDFVPGDPGYGQQWGLPDIKAPQAWDTTTGNAIITIAIVDSGVDMDHPDLMGGLTAGYNAISNGTDTNDDYGHGTHVAGIAAARIDNGIGGTGMAGRCRIMPVKVADSTGYAYAADIAEGVIWAADNGARVINMSLSGPDYAQAFQDAINYAFNKGVVIVAAAGNNGLGTNYYPAAYNNVIAVSAVDQSNARASFSNYGNHIDVAAPGVGIYSTTFDGAYGNKDGTSMAAPFVTGTAALLLSKNPGLNPTQVENMIKCTAVDLGTAGKDPYFGYGLVDAAAAVTKVFDVMPATPVIQSDGPDPFVPSGTNTCKITYTMPETGTVTLKIYNSSGTLVRTLMDNKPTNAATWDVLWDGKNSSNAIVPGDIYTYTFTTLDAVWNASAPVSGTITVNRYAPSITNINASPSTLSGGGSVSITYTLSQNANVTAGIYNSASTLVKTLAAAAAQKTGTNTVVWDGKLSDGVTLATDDTYTCKFTAVDCTNTTSTASKAITVERANPVISGVSDGPDPLRPTDTAVNTINYSLSEKAKVTLKIYNSSGTLIQTLVNATTLTGVQTAKWDGKNSSGMTAPDGIYTYKIDAVDMAGKAAIQAKGTITLDTASPTISNISASPNPFKYVTSTDKTKITYIISETSNVSVAVYDSTGTLVKTVCSNVLQNGGTNSVYWDGTNNSNAVVAAGVYTYVITGVDLVGLSTNGGNTITFTR